MRGTIRLLCIVVLAATTNFPAQAQRAAQPAAKDYPARFIRIIVPYGAGGVTDLLALVPGSAVGRIGNAFDCCGLGGIMGFKKSFHPVSVAIGRRLRDKIDTAAPTNVLTDCLSCRMQFEQMQERPVTHPVEILAAAYRKD